MARRVLSSVAVLGLCLALVACKRDAPKQARASASASAADESDRARQAHFESEQQLAQARWKEQPDLGNCAEILQKNQDLELCRRAATALGEVERLDPAAGTDTVIPRLADAALALVRLLDRARYLNFEDFGRRRQLGDAGAAPAASSALGVAPPPPVPSGAGRSARPIQRVLRGALREPRSLKAVASPVQHLVETTSRLEHDVLRQLGAYLEYAALPVRRVAFERMKAVQAEHPRWPTLLRVLREAAVLETDSALKQSLNELAHRGLPQRAPPDQPTGSK